MSSRTAEAALPTAGGSRQTLVAAVLCIAGTVVALQQTLVIPLIPEWPALLHANADDTSWLVTATLLAGAVATPILARLADMVGKKKIMLVSLAFVIVGSLIGGLGSGLPELIVARTFQGVGASMIPIGISILRDVLPRERVGGAVATMSATLGIGSAIGLPLAGFIVQHYSWHMVFWVSVISAGLMFAAVVVLVPESKVTSRGRFDVLGAVLLSTALLCLLVPISKGGHWGWGSERVLLLFAASATVFAFWAPYELRHSSPMVDLRTSTRKPVLLTNVASLLVGYAMYANMMTTTQQLQMPEVTGYGFGMSVLAAGVAMLPGGLVMVVLSPLTARITNRHGARTTLLIGALGLAVAYTLRVFLTDSVWHVVLGATLCSASTAFAYAAMPTLIMRSVPLTETASANGLNNLLRSIGTSTSSAAVAAIVTSMTMHVGGHDLPKLDAFKAVFVMAAIAALASAVVTAFIPRIQPVTGPAAAPLREADAVRAGGSREIVVTGNLASHGGEPIRRGVVTALDPDGTHLDWGRVDENGSYRLALPGHGRYVLVGSADGWATRSQFVDVTTGSIPQLTLLHPLQLSGVVRDANGNALAGIPVTLIKHSGEYHANATTDAEGRYVMSLPPGGRYVVTALDAEHDATASRTVSVLATPAQVDLDLVSSAVR